MTTLRRYAYIAFAVACTHLVFGAIVRISGSGMGCGDHWPRCYGSFFPPLNRPDLIIEVSHRYLASILLLSLIALLVAAWRRRTEPGVGGPGGVLRSSALAVTLGFSAALLGAMTVKMGNAPFATLAHWTVAMSLVATVVATVIRTGGLGGTSPRLRAVSGRTKRATLAAAAMALAAVVMGGLTAKYPGAAVACRSFPLCGTNPDVERAAVDVQITHRILAVLLVLHLFGLVMAQRKRRESPVILRAATIAMSLGVLQLLVAGAMIGMHLPPVLRSLHEATGVSVWIATFALAYLASVAPGAGSMVSPAGDDELTEGAVRGSGGARHAYSSAVAEPELSHDARDAHDGDGWRVALVDQHLGAAAMWRPRRPFVPPALEASVNELMMADAASRALDAAMRERGERTPEQRTAEQLASAPPTAEQRAAEQPAAEQRTAEQQAAAQRAAQRAAELAAEEQLAADLAAEELRAAELAVVEEAIAEACAAEVDVAEGDADLLVIESVLEEIVGSDVANDVVAEPEVVAPTVPDVMARRSTMSHSVAVIVARGADF